MSLIVSLVSVLTRLPCYREGRSPSSKQTIDYHHWSTILLTGTFVRFSSSNGYVAESVVLLCFANYSLQCQKIVPLTFGPSLSSMQCLSLPSPRRLSAILNVYELVTLGEFLLFGAEIRSERYFSFERFDRTSWTTSLSLVLYVHLIPLSSHTTTLPVRA